MPQTLESQLDSARTALENDNLEVAARRFNDIFLDAITKKDYPNAVHAKADESSALRHLYERDGDVAYAHAALSCAELGLKLANKYNLSGKLGVAHFRIATSLMLFAKYNQAVASFQRAQQNFQGSVAERMVWMIHLHEAEFWAGRFNLTTAEASIRLDIASLLRRSKDEDPYTLAVWVTGGHLALARIQRQYRLFDQARASINETMHIIEEYESVSNPKKMTIRRRQAQKLRAEIESMSSREAQS